MALKRVVMRLE